MIYYLNLNGIYLLNQKLFNYLKLFLEL